VKNKHNVANKKPKNTLRLPDLDQAKSAVLKPAIKGVSAGLSAFDRGVRCLVLLRTAAFVQ
jgi:hypothetical protein